MSKQDKAKEIDSKSIISGFIAPSTETNTKQVETKKEVKPKDKPSDNIKVSEDIKKTFDAKKGHYNKTNNYTITFKIDADIDDYLKNIDKITFIESVKSGKIESKTKTEFVNNLIRQEMYKLIGVSVKDDADTINQKWLKYKDDNNL